MAKSSGTDRVRNRAWKERTFYTYECKEASTENLLDRLKHLMKNRFTTGINRDMISKQLRVVEIELKKRNVKY